MPFAGYPDFDACVLDQQHKGHSADSSRRICGALQNKVESVQADRASIAFTPDGVEVKTPGTAPTAFRIWNPGENPTDHGMSVFSERSASLLMEEQARRGNLYSIDVGHASLNKEAPIENQRAVGWHKLEVRNGELWAVEVEWAEWVAKGFECNPPEWKYFSPAYDCDPDTDEVISYTNTAITINPATWNVTALASRASRSDMKYSEMMEAMKKMAEADDEDGKKAKMALAAMQKHEADEAKKAADEAKKAEADDEAKKADDAPPSSKPASSKPASSAPPSSKEAKSGPPSSVVPSSKKSKKAKKDSKDPVIKLAAQVQNLHTRLDDLQSREERKRLLASRPDFRPEVRQWLSNPKTTMDTVREAVKVIPREVKKPAAEAQPGVQATRGEGQKQNPDAINGRQPKRSAAENTDMRAKMGLPVQRQDAIRQEGNSVVFATMSQEEARARLAKKGGN